MMVIPDAAIGIDIGGSATKLGLITKEGELIASGLVLTPATMTAKVIMQAICAQVDELIKISRARALNLVGMGISVCGYLEADGESPDYINLHALDHYPVVRHLRERYGLPAVMDNDMNCGVLGEYYFGGGRGERRLMVMTVGTGIGMGMIIDGKVLRIHVGTVGNPGHIIVDADGPICDAGCRGCLESLSAARAISRRAEDVARAQRETQLTAMLEAKGHLNPRDVFEAAEGGDEAAKEIWTVTGKWLGRGLASWVEIFGPEVVIVGGGIAQAGRWLLKPLMDEFYRCGEPYFTRRVREIKKSELGQSIAMLGAASMSLFPENAPRWKSAV
jgi:glucokinase